ncbi:MAG: hypothetical protein R2879_19465 [Saprospiraceae bacterium]
MNTIGVDFIGEVSLMEDSTKTKPLIQGWWGVSNLKGSQINHSYYIYLLERKQIFFGESSKAEFKFKFSSDERFQMKVLEGQVIELTLSRKIGEFKIEKIVNEKFILKDV